MAAHYFNTVENNVTGKPVAGASVSVLVGSAEATIYSDDGMTAADNPLTTDSLGWFEFWTNETSITLEISYGGAVQRTITDVDLVGGSVSSDVTALNTRMDTAEVVTTDATIIAFKGLTGTVDTVPYFTGTDIMALADFTAAGRALVDDADAAAQRTTLGLGTAATTAATAYAASGIATGSGLTMATARLLGRTTASSGAIEELTAGTGLTLSAGSLSVNATAVKPTECLIVACSDETTAITTGTAKVTFRMPYAFTLSAVRASATAAPTGSTILIDINETGTTILSTKLMIDASEKTSTTAGTPAVISDTSLADDAEMTIDFDQVGSTIAGAGIKVYLIGTRT